MLPELVKGVDLKLTNGRDELIEALDTDLVELFNKALSVEEADKVPVCYFVQDSVLMRKYRLLTCLRQTNDECTDKLLYLQSTGQRYLN